ncbi:lysophospholipid acyltransferase family protein [Fimbriimonas ginsengisoli]|uniref:1-acyl-sn-glycerol-3-phosphate acyltransferase n=1 Tax=Fimbriimonas ginsengisoli Gsoil 348 TaxID=661478 RepID=A0A068NLJ1_FIMGI|nr:lysophospholipid acyltransferase family protein [Fimbriimonas ginsengisoli]AIE84287.1 1-acyl-sn-glycerol-3-phosphate acyltransferase [Fimbriimonas ginsengisoli Gsoil 348]
MASAWYAFARWATKTFFYGSKGGLRSVGQENVPLTGPLIVAPNHVSNLDPPAVACGTKRRQLRFMAKEELFKGFLGKLISSLGAFPVKRGEGDTESIRNAIAILESGEALLIFPEGTRGDGRTMLPVNRGVTMLAKRTNALVLPVGIIGTHIVSPKGAKGKSHPMLVAYGEPFTYQQTATGANERENRELFAAELEKRILALCNANGLPLKSAASIEGSAESGGPAPELAG